jgi:hypothetical protein
MVSHKKKKLYTLDEANKSLPLVSAIAADYLRLHRNVAERRDRLTEIASRRDERTADLYSDELEGAVRKLKKDTERLEEFAQELRQLGLESSSDGVIEFPAEMFGREVYLSWQVGESKISHWRDPESAKSDRVSLANAAALASESCGDTLGL